MTAKRRRLRGKKLLIASAGLASASAFASCGDDTVANLLPPPDTGRVDGGGRRDGGGDDMDAQIRDASRDAPASFDVGLEELPVANLLPPPDAGGK
jgi:hypothetical protein